MRVIVMPACSTSCIAGFEYVPPEQFLKPAMEPILFLLQSALLLPFISRFPVFSVVCFILLLSCRVPDEWSGLDESVRYPLKTIRRLFSSIPSVPDESVHYLQYNPEKVLLISPDPDESVRYLR